MATFIEELKRRKVFRVGAVYVVVAWIVLQLTDLVFENLSAPDWVMQAIMLALAVGFPIALILAWAFEVTPEGVQREDNDPAQTVQTARNTRLFYVGLVLILAAGVGLFFIQGQPESTEPVERVAQESEGAPDGGDRSLLAIAVLPFESFTEDREDQYFADGLADTLLNKLAQLQTLTVIARNSSFQFKGQNLDVREIGKTLGVPTVLEGSVQRQGDQIRVIAQLVNTENGAHWWSGTFDGTFENIFELQDAIAAAIAEQLQVTLSEHDRERLYRNGTSIPEAYDMLVRAGAIEHDYDAEGWDPSTDRKLELLKRVVELDPNYALGWANLSGYYNDLAFLEAAPDHTDELIRESLAAAQQAIEVDPDEEQGYVALGFAYWRERDLGPAEEAFRTALVINPNSDGGMAGLGLILVRKNPEEALRLFTRTRQIDPTSKIVYRQLYFSLFALGRLDEGLAWLEKGIQQAPDFWLLYDDLADAYASSFGRYDEAARVASSLLKRNPDSRTGIASMAEQWFAVNDLAHAKAWVAALEERYPDHNDTLYLRADVVARSGDIAGAVEISKSIRGSGIEIFQRGLMIVNLCLLLDDRACANEELNKISAFSAKFVERGMKMPAIVDAVFSLLNAALQIPDATTAQAELSDVAASMIHWPLLDEGNRDFKRRGLIRAMALAQLHRPDYTFAELDSTLDIPDGGFVATALGSLPPELSYFFAPVRGSKKFDEWFIRFDARRAIMRERMIEMEAAGEIAKAP